MSPVLVTGGSGYVGTQLIAALLRDGTAVRTTVRSLDREAGLREAVRRGGADDAGLEVVVADLTAADGWPGAVAGCAGIYHVASPMIQPKDPDELIVPARDGTLRVLRAARAAGARRVVLTSSFAAVGYTPKPSADYTEADWTDPDTPGLHPYPRAKAIAERAAWDFIEHEGAGTELVVVNPTFILGRDRLGPLAEGVPTEEAPGDELPDLVIHNDRARNELGWRPRPAETTIVETAESLRDLGLLDQHQ